MDSSIKKKNPKQNKTKQKTAKHLFKKISLLAFGSDVLVEI